MSFSTEIRNLITSTTDISSHVDGIYYENLPDNYDKEKTWIVYSFNINNTEKCLNGSSLFKTYNLYIKVVTQDTLKLETISDIIINYLDGNGTLHIVDVIFQGDDHTMNLEEGIYMNTLQFNVIY